MLFRSGKPTLDSASAYDFRFKARFISEANNGKNIFLLDATPTPNKPMELYTMIGHLDKDIFKEYGIHSEMDFAGRYFDNGMAPDRNGEFKSALTGINNAPELRAVMDRYVDRISMEQFASMGYIKIPDKKIITHTLEASSESITAFDVISKKLKDKKELLGAYANGINASADPRLYQQAGITDFINPTPQNNKLHAVVDEVLKVRGKDAKAGQIIFLDNAIIFFYATVTDHQNKIKYQSKFISTDKIKTAADECHKNIINRIEKKLVSLERR